LYEPHPTFVQPDNLDIKVWRYLDFTKLVSLVDSRRLYFTRADKFADPFEGSWPKINVAARQNVPDEIPKEGRESFQKEMSKLGLFTKSLVKHNAINCWHMNEHESAAMWELYLKSDEGVAVQSTYRKLRDSFIDDEKVYVGVVRYIDYEKEWIDAGNLFGPYVHKRKSFEHEREVRALVAQWPKRFDAEQETIGHGVKIRVDIERLMERIYVAPTAPSWFAELIQAVIQRYGYGFEVAQSQLNVEPVY
jgi:hypothetical protein